MASSIEGKITAGLLEHFALLALPAGTKVAQPGINFTPESGKPFISLEVHHNTPVDVDIAMETDPIRRGFMRANVFWPSGQGVIKATDLAALIAEHFGRGLRITFEGVTIWIIDSPELAGDIQATTHFSIPVTIRWQVYP